MGKENRQNIPRENLGDKKDAIEAYFGAPKRKISAEVAPITPGATAEIAEEKAKEGEEYGNTKNVTRIEGGNLLSGAPGRKGRERTPESTRLAVETIYKTFHPKTVITFEIPSDYSGDTSSIEEEKKAWRELGVEVIELPVSETDLEKLLQGELREKTLKAFKALDRGQTYVHCTHGLHRARAFIEIWRATRGIDRRAALAQNTAYNTAESHGECRDDASAIIKRIFKAREQQHEQPREQTEAIPREEAAARIALIGDSIGEGISGAIKQISSQHKVTAISSARLQEGSKKYREISTSQLQEIDPKKTPYLVIQGGTNDLDSNSPEVVAGRLRQLYQKAIKMGFEKVVIVTIPPHKKESYTQKVLDTNAILREMARKGEIVIYDLYEDYVKKDPNLAGIGNNSVHPNHKGHEILGNLIVDSFAKKAQTSGSYSAEVASTLAAGAAAAAADTGAASDAETTTLPPATLPPETVAPAPTSTEHQTPESQALQKALQAELEKLAQDEEKIKAASIKDIRFNTALLNGNEDKVQEEMRRRLAQYTDKQEDGGLRLNYMKFNQLTGLDHEMGIGLGDVMPPEYTRLLIITPDGRYRLGQRGIVPHKGTQRVGYMDEATGEYLATYSGDVIYVLDPPLTDKAQLDALLAKEKQMRAEGKTTYNEPTISEDYRSSDSPYDLPEHREHREHSEHSAENQENLSLKDEAIRGLDKNIAGKKFWDYSRVKIKITIDGREVSWEYDPSVSEGANIYNYSKAICEAHGIGNMITTVWAIIRAESRFNPFNTHHESTATGLGQPLEKTWKSFIPRAKKSSDPFIKSMLEGAYGKGIEYEKRGPKKAKKTIVIDLGTDRYPPSSDYRNYSRCNPYLNVYSTIMGIIDNARNYEKNSSKTGITDFNRLSVENQLRLLYLSHHDGEAGGPGVLAFMKYLSENLGMDISSRERVMAFIASDTTESQQALQLMKPSTRDREYARAKSRDPEEREACLRSWYQTCQKVVRFATGKKNFLDTSIPKMTEARAVASASSEEGLQQPLQARTVLPPQELDKIRATAEASSFQYDAVYVLGSKDPITNKKRAEIGAELAIAKGAAFLTSGGFTENHEQISEGKEAMDHVHSNPRYSQLFYNDDRPPAIEDKSTNTKGNIRNAIAYFRKNGHKKILIVTDGTGHALRAIHPKDGKGLKDLYPEAQISFYTPKSPDIDRNMGTQRAKQTAQVESYRTGQEPERQLQEKEELSTTDLLQIFKSGNKEEIDRIIAQYGYPSLREIENQLKDVPPGKFEEDPTGVIANINQSNNEILLTFDICSNYQGDNEKNVLNFINDVMSKRPPVPVILFVTGSALSNPRIRSAVEEAARYPHISIQNHGYAHRPLCTAPGREKPYGIIPTSGIEEAYYEVVKGAILIQSTTGKKPEFYRSSTLYADPRGVRLAEILGLKTLGRTNDTGDHQELGEERAGNIVLRHAIKPSSIAFVENMRARIQKQEIKPTLNIA